jgi:hypothetical protein
VLASSRGCSRWKATSLSSLCFTFEWLGQLSLTNAISLIDCARGDSFAFPVQSTNAPRPRCPCMNSLQEFQPLLHADETKTSALLCRFAIKAHAGIHNREMNLVRRFPQSHFEVPYPTMLRGVS